ncbi:MAG: FtsX-like permease family protein [Methanobacterium sp.]|nr:FtsX-like permease family protein [Methanobacterium sp.]
MLDIAFKDFKAKKSRALMCIIGVMVCVLLIGTVNNVLYEMENGLKGDLGTVNGKLYFEKNGTGFPPYGSILNEELGDEVLNQSQVNREKSTKALFSALEGTQTDSGFSIIIVGLTPGKEQAFIQNATVNGKSSLVGEADNAIIMGSEAAIKYNATVGETITVNDNQYKVIGIMNKQGTGWPLSIDYSMVMALNKAQNISSMPNLTSTVIIIPSSSYTIQSAETSLQDTYPKYSILSEQDAEKTIDKNLSQIRIFMNMINAFIFIVSIVFIMNVMMMTVKEKTKEIGTMRAIGTRKRSIMKLIIYESLIMSVIGGIIGIILISPVYNLMGLLMGYTGIDFLSFYIPPLVLVQLLVIIFVIGTFSGLLPAYLANRISPIEALRYE